MGHDINDNDALFLPLGSWPVLYLSPFLFLRLSLSLSLYFVLGAVADDDDLIVDLSTERWALK